MASQSTLYLVRPSEEADQIGAGQTRKVPTWVKAKAAETLAGVGLALSDAVRILLTRVAAEGGLPVGLTADPEAYDAWFRAKVREALDDPRPAIPHEQVMTDTQALIDGKRRART